MACDDLVLVPIKISVPRSIPSVDFNPNQDQMRRVGSPGGPMCTNILTMALFAGGKGGPIRLSLVLCFFVP